VPVEASVFGLVGVFAPLFEREVEYRPHGFGERLDGNDLALGIALDKAGLHEVREAGVVEQDSESLAVLGRDYRNLVLERRIYFGGRVRVLSVTVRP
jgi:hypothetical protein